VPKIKTNRGAAKRFKLTATGKIKRSKAFANHNIEGQEASLSVLLLKQFIELLLMLIGIER